VGLPSEYRAYLDELEPEAIAEYLDERLHRPERGDFVEVIRALLTPRPIEPLIEYVAERIPQLQSAHAHVRFEFEAGHLRRTRLGQEPIGNPELEQLAKVA